MTTVTSIFTFGQTHSCSHPDMKAPVKDHWVRVTTLEGESPRAAFIEHFMNHYCPSPSQFGFEYTPENFDASYFPAGELTHIDTTGEGS